MAVFIRVSAVLTRINFGYGLTRNCAANCPLVIVCQEAAHRHKTVQHALFEMVDSSCKLDPPVSFYRKGHQTT